MKRKSLREEFLEIFTDYHSPNYNQIADFWLAKIGAIELESRTDAMRMAQELIKIAGTLNIPADTIVPSHKITEDFKVTAQMVIRALKEEDGMKYVKYLEDRVLDLETQLSTLTK